MSELETAAGYLLSAAEEQTKTTSTLLEGLQTEREALAAERASLTKERESWASERASLVAELGKLSKTREPRTRTGWAGGCGQGRCGVLA
jgi:hypothetical protein